MHGVGHPILAGLLALVALTGGISKTFVPREKLATLPGGRWTGRWGRFGPESFTG
ncbi:hypothetical protein KBX50_31800 [Micromonospora sp. C51]|uniref:hypothetical protein n=1 Tax=Micromonospora sp. C51 TaxID=2824879 RepID=UPI001B38252B|nr:hypothetical protein [Micromonospora sp. C51]MBQ1053022.1 hypothetical protein [Micromonospora sp. C51]